MSIIYHFLKCNLQKEAELVPAKCYAYFRCKFNMLCTVFLVEIQNESKMKTFTILQQKNGIKDDPLALITMC